LLLREKGVVGAGGAGFPTYAKLRREGIRVYVVNGAECEPLLWVSKELLRTRAKEVLQGLKVLCDYTGATRGVVALKGKHREVVEALRREIALGGYPFEVFECGDYYPEGDEHVLVYELLGRPIPPMGIPISLGAVVNNVETVYNVYRAVFEGRPVVEKFLTVGGDVERPVTVKVPVGMRFGDLLRALGVSFEGKVLVEGGPVTGRPVSPDSPVTRTSGGVLVFPQGHPAVAQSTARLEWILRRARTCCIQCRYCTEQCPRYLLGHDLQPHRIMNAMAFGVVGNVRRTAQLCSECGVCEVYSCPQGLSPRLVNRYLKGELSRQGQRYEPPAGETVARDDREHRKVPTDRLKARMGLKGFDRYAPLSDEPIDAREVVLPMKQHIGAPAVPVVLEGDLVEVGQVVGRAPEGALGVDVHSSISGRVVYASGEAVVVRREGA